MWGSKIAGRVPFWSASKVGIAPTHILRVLTNLIDSHRKSPQKIRCKFFRCNLFIYYMNTLTDAQKIVELNRLLDFNHKTIEDCLAVMRVMEKDAVIGRLVRDKFKSGNNIPVTRITLDRSEIDL